MRSSRQFLGKNPHMNLLRLTPSELQHWGSRLKGTSATQEETEDSGSKVSTAFSQAEGWAEAIIPFLNPSPTEPQSQQAGAISETPSTWLTLFAPPRRSPETPSHPTYHPTQTAFPYEWLVLAQASQLPKSYQTSHS